MIDDDFMMLNNLLLEQIMQYWISEHCSAQQLEHNQFQCAMKMQLVSFNDVFQLLLRFFRARLFNKCEIV